MLPTLLGVLLLTFIVTQFVPGGPVEQYLAEAGRAAAARAATPQLPRRQGVDPKRIEQIKALYGFDKPPPSASSRCWGSTRASTWARASSRTRTSGT
jgi:microcin C transport system permease protein